MINQKNTFVSLAEQLALMNKNTIEIISKLNDVVSNNNSVISVNLINSDGTSSAYQLPSISQLKTDLDIANRNIKKLAGLNDSTAYISDGTTFRKVYVDDLNREPEPINNLNIIKQFKTVNNSFLESLNSPMLSVQIDLTDKIDRKVNKVLSRRYVIKFQKNEEGNYTTDGLTSKTDFENKFLNRNDVYIDDFINWYNNTKNYGVVRYNEPYDEQYFELDYNMLQYYGLFDVVGVDNDTINKKLWYILGSLTYFDIYGNTKQLTIGDKLIINKKDSATKWEIKEISTSKSNYRVILERIEGLDPIPILTQALKIYSPELTNKTIKVSINYDEYNIIFIKGINTDANIISSVWSYGTSFYSNDLVLDVNDTISMPKFYAESVLDYGSILKDLVSKNIATKYGVVPNIPILESSNFKVVQTNKHLTDSSNSTKIKELHAQKISVKSKLEQLSDAITEKTKEISTKQFKTASERQANQTQLNNLISQQESQTKLYISIVNKISAENNGTVSNENPDYSVRGFFSFPAPIIINNSGEQKIQEAIRFKIQYRKSAKGGSEPTTEGFSLNMIETIYSPKTSTGDIIDQTKSYKNPDITTKTSSVTGYFSNWCEIISPIRKRSYNKSLGVFTWDTEDVTNANNPKINQIDIPIKPNEQIEIKIKSISEVGFYDAPIESDWSDILIVEFPDELSTSISSTKNILQEATNEQLYTQIENKFNSKGLTTHLQQSYNVNELYVAHTDSNIATSIKDSSGNVVMMNTLINELINRITSLEEIISGAKGSLSVKLFKNSTEINIENGGVVTIPIICEDYAILSGSTNRKYHNNVYVIGDYYLQFINESAGSNLGLLSYRKYVPTLLNDNRFYNPTYAKGSLASYINSKDELNIQQNNQYVWFSDTSNTKQIYNTGSTYNSAGLGKILYSKECNIGLTGNTTPNSFGKYGDPINIFNNINWTDVTWAEDSDYQTSFPVTIHPYVENITDLCYTESGGIKNIPAKGKFTIPIKIFFKLSSGSTDSVTFASNTSTSPVVTKKLRLFIEPDNLARAFEFEIAFTVYRNSTANLRSNINIIS